MTLHIFNPEHDIALASNLSNFTAPKAGRQLRHDLGFLPLLWAGEGDSVLVDDIEYAKRQWSVLSSQLAPIVGAISSNYWGNLLQLSEPIAPRAGVTNVSPWGWDKALCGRLKILGLDEKLLPSDELLQQIRQWSHRRTASRLLPQLQQEGTVGEAFECATTAEVLALRERFCGIVAKAPWSSSGRGVRVLLTDEEVQNAMKWMENVIMSQGSIMIEPYYKKAMDLGMEFKALQGGELRYDGLSLFDTHNSAYTGNLLATESIKQEIISRYIPMSLLDTAKQKIMSLLRFEGYTGPLGVDMMIVENSGNGKRENGSEYLLHPCVEINLRRTMGHVALRLTPPTDDVLFVMNISYDGSHYLFNIKEWQET